MRPSLPPQLMIMDACVLIDFIKADRVVLELIVKHVGQLYVTASIVGEIHEIDDGSELIGLGINIIEPEIEDAYDAAGRSGPLSFSDWLCLLTAKRHGCTCVTNDKNLRKYCTRENIPLLWGLELITKLHHAGGITARDGEIIARRIGQLNPKHITENIISDFVTRLRQQEKSGRDGRAD